MKGEPQNPREGSANPTQEREGPTQQEAPIPKPKRKGEPSHREGPTPGANPCPREETFNPNPKEEGPTRHQGPTPSRRATPYLRVLHHHFISLYMVFIFSFNYSHRKLANPMPKKEGPTPTRRGQPRPQTPTRPPKRRKGQPQPKSYVQL